jgi:hypothetical protein
LGIELKRIISRYRSVKMLEYQKLDQKKIFLDRDGDGIIDSIDLELHLTPSCSRPTVLPAIMDLSASLGFETTGMNLPLVKAGGERDSSFKNHLYIGLNQELETIYSGRGENDCTLGQNDQISLARAIREFSYSLISSEAGSFKGRSIRKDRKREGFDLLNPFSNQGFFCSSSKSILPFLLPYKILLFSHLHLNTAVEAANFACRLGLESLHLSLPLTIPLREKPKSQENFIYIGKKEDLEQCGLAGLGEVTKCAWASGIFLFPYQKRIPDVLICGDERGLEEILHYLSCLPTDSKEAKDSIFNKIRIFQDGLRELISKDSSHAVSSPRNLVRNYTIPDESEEIINLLGKGLKSRISKPNSIRIETFMARPEGVREKFREDIEGFLERLGLGKGNMHVTVLNAYKPGLSWMKEVVLKEMTQKKADRVEIAFKKFKTEGLEEPIRWLQELYPVDEILARGLSISKDKIQFKKDSRMKEVYRVRAWRAGRVVYENQFSPKWIEKPYLIFFPRLGKVHPCTGWVSMRIDGEEVINQRVKTWIEIVWEIYQNEILSLIAKESEKVLSTKKLLPQYPIFEELRFGIYFDYPMERLKVDEERLSPLEALHEDFYFVTLDFFSNLMKRKGLKGISPGRVLPIIHSDFRGKKGKMEFTLIHRSEEAFSSSQKDWEIGISLNGIFFNRSKVGVDLFIKVERDRDHRWLNKRLQSYSDRENHSFKVKKITEQKQKGFRLIASGPGFSREPESLKQTGQLKPIQIPMERPIGYREGIRIVHSLGNVPGVKVVEEGRSFRGLPILSLQHTYPSRSAFISHAKRVLWRPTFFVNCRHHANEISSTNAGLRLSYSLATRPPFRELLKKVNVVINPMENVDGVAILEEMLRFTPTDKLHAARYNAAGQEYYKEYFNPQTPFGEAKAKPAIWERWLPDICVDDHGFPSHEWDQPFSGYAPFRFREWWIPRALFYFYLPYLEEKARSSKRRNSEFLRDWITNILSKEKDIARWNQTFSARYLKYRQRWFQRVQRSDDVIPFLPLKKRFRRTNYSYRHPSITTVDLITEVADETAQGKFLRTCVNAHLQTNLSILKLLCSFDISVKKLCRYQNGQTHFLWHRERPLNFKTARKEVR